MVTLLALAVFAQLSPETAAAIERDLELAEKAVNRRHGDRKVTDLSLEEREALRVDQAEAERQVLERYGVGPRDWVRNQSRRSREDRELIATEKQRLDEEAAARSGDRRAPAEEEVTVQLGRGDDDPAVVDEVEGAPPVVEQGLPPDAERDGELAAELDQVQADEGKETTRAAKSGKAPSRRTQERSTRKGR